MADIPAKPTTTAVLEGNSDLGTFSGVLETLGDHDWIRVELTDGETFEIYLCFLQDLTSASGASTLTLRDEDGNQVAFDAGSGVGLNSFLSFDVTSTGTYFIDVGEVGDNATGEYSLLATTQDQIESQLSTDNDVYTGAAGERILGGTGADRIDIGAGVDALGEQGNDIIIGNAASNIISGGLGDDTLDGKAGADRIFGDAGNDIIFGGDAGDILRGGAGNDHIFGEAGSDFVFGGLGKDVMSGGGNSDVFIFTTLADSQKGAGRDIIVGFFSSDGDQIHLSTIDAKNGVAGNQTFKFINSAKFHDKKGELHFVTKSGFLLVEGDVNGDGKADFQIEVHGVGSLVADNFSL